MNPDCTTAVYEMPRRADGPRTHQEFSPRPTGPAFAFIPMVVSFIIGCGANDGAAPVAPASDSVRSEVIRGPVTLTVEITPDKMRLSDEPVLTLTIKSDPGIVVSKPPFGESVGEFLIRDFHEALPTSKGEASLIRQTYTLEPTRAGTLTIAPIAVRFQDQRPQGDGKEHVIESEALNVEVTTIVGDDAPSLDDLKPSAAPVELPSSGPPWWVWMTTGLVIGTAVAIGWLVRRKQQRARQKPPLTPQQLAQLELEQIIGRRLAESDIKAFYQELTGVVRRYIERSTGVRAPEQTTEEFLREILTRSVFADEEQRRLRQFLESADLVKFAGHQPAESDVDTSLDRAREFTQLTPEHSEDEAE